MPIKKILLSLLLITPLSYAEEMEELLTVSTEIPVVSIIIDDLGTNRPLGLDAVSIPGNLTYAILPKTPYSREIAILANESGKEVMMHQPMESTKGLILGAGGITSSMDIGEIYQTLDDNFTTVPYSRGINNHMGSLLTADPEMMIAVMESLKRRGDYYFVDSITTKESVASVYASYRQIPNTRRNIFLDNERTFVNIKIQFQRLIDQAREVGSSVAIGHPYPETIAALKRLVPTLKEEGVILIPVSEMIQQRKLRVSSPLWHASLSQSPKAQKSLRQ